MALTVEKRSGGGPGEVIRREEMLQTEKLESDFSADLNLALTD